MVAVQLLFLGYRRYGPDGGELGGGLSAVNEIVVEDVARTSLACPEQCLVGVGPRKSGQRREWLFESASIAMAQRRCDSLHSTRGSRRLGGLHPLPWTSL